MNSEGHSEPKQHLFGLGEVDMKDISSKSFQMSFELGGKRLNLRNIKC